MSVHQTVYCAYVGFLMSFHLPDLRYFWHEILKLIPKQAPGKRVLKFPSLLSTVGAAQKKIKCAPASLPEGGGVNLSQGKPLSIFIL